MYSNWVKVLTTQDKFAAELLKQSLLGNGINAVILDQEDSSFMSYGNVYVLVEAADEEAARTYMLNNNIQ